MDRLGGITVLSGISERFAVGLTPRLVVGPGVLPDLRLADSELVILQFPFSCKAENAQGDADGGREV